MYITLQQNLLSTYEYILVHTQTYECICTSTMYGYTSIRKSVKSSTLVYVALAFKVGRVREGTFDCSRIRTRTRVTLTVHFREVSVLRWPEWGLENYWWGYRVTRLLFFFQWKNHKPKFFTKVTIFFILSNDSKAHAEDGDFELVGVYNQVECRGVKATAIETALVVENSWDIEHATYA